MAEFTIILLLTESVTDILLVESNIMRLRNKTLMVTWQQYFYGY